MPDKLNLDSQLLAEIAEAVRSVLGLSFPPERYRQLERAVFLQGQCTGEAPLDVALAMTGKAEGREWQRKYIEEMSRFLTVGETYFFREPVSLISIKNLVLPALIEGKRAVKRLKIWSAGCCTGEEVYSLSMILPVLSEDWQVTIYGTDINSESLETARRGVYGDKSMRHIDSRFDGLKRLLQQPAEGSYVVGEKLKRQVEFARVNLACTPYPDFLRELDLIVCRNVLIYFEPEERRRTIAELGHCLAPGGWLCLGAAEFEETDGLVVHTLDGDEPAGEKTFFMRKPADTELDLYTQARQAQLETARRRFQSGDYSGTSRLLKKLEDELGENERNLSYQTLELQTKALTNCGSFDEALAGTKAFIQRNPQMAEGYYLQAMVLHEKGLPLEAVDNLQAALSINSQLHVASFMLASFFLSVDEGEKAAEYLSRLSQDLLKLAPETVLSFSEGTTAGELLHIVKELARKQ